MVSETRGQSIQLWGLGDQRSRTHDVEVRFGGLAETSYWTIILLELILRLNAETVLAFMSPMCDM